MSCLKSVPHSSPTTWRIQPTSPGLAPMKKAMCSTERSLDPGDAFFFCLRAVAGCTQAGRSHLSARNFQGTRRKSRKPMRQAICLALTRPLRQLRVAQRRYEPPSVDSGEQIGCSAISGPGHGPRGSTTGAAGPSEVPCQQTAVPPGNRLYSSWTNLPVAES